MISITIPVMDAGPAPPVQLTLLNTTTHPNFEAS